jgi:hypothetical protein
LLIMELDLHAPSQQSTTVAPQNNTGQLTQARAISQATNAEEHFALNQRRRMKMNKARSGGGSTMNKNVSPPVRTGSPSKGSSPGAADQIGASTAFKKDQVDARPGYDGAKYGNEVALNVGKGGPGTGRTIMPCGSQGMHGLANQGESPRNAPRGIDSRGPLKGEV